LLLSAIILTAIGFSHMPAAHAQSVGDAKLADLQSLVDKYDGSHPAAQAAAHVQVADSSLSVGGAQVRLYRHWSSTGIALQQQLEDP
jgi:hypothetical protein